MPSGFLKDLVDHKSRVAGYMQLVANDLFERVVDFGDAIPYHSATDEDITLMDMVDVVCKLKRDGESKFYPEKQLGGILRNTVEGYLVQYSETTTCSWIGFIMQDLFHRAAVHDNSKFEPEEFDPYDKAFPELQKYPYGSVELRAVYKSIKPALQHHFQNNDHHPEFFEDGINSMHIVQLKEMVCDWLAASERSQTSIMTGLEINKERYGIDDQTYRIIVNTAKHLAPEKFLVFEK